MRKKPGVEASGQDSVAVGSNNYGTILTNPVFHLSQGESQSQGWEPPQSIPPEVPDFTGRDREIEILGEVFPQRPTAKLITGKPGVGKTSLALHVAYRKRNSYRDGVLYADLHGIEKAPPPPEDIMRRFLHGVGVPEEDIPTDSDLRLDRYRREFANRKIIVILDNAGSEGQVRPLIPPGRTAFVLITSRFQLSGLEAIQPLLLDVFDENSSIDFLRRTLGKEVVEEDLASAQKVSALCGYLPLALRIAANRVRNVPLRELAAELANQRDRLEALEAGDLAVRTAFQLSYRKLGKGAKNALKRLSHVPGEDFGPSLCAALNDSDERSARSTLRKLHENNLIESSARSGRYGFSGRYRFHDLVKVYAQEKFDEDPSDKRIAAIRRMLEWLSYSALKANLALSGQAPRFEFPPIQIANISSIKTAKAWLDCEISNVIPAIKMLAEIQEIEQAKRLAIYLALACEMVGNWQAWEDVVTVGLQVTESAPDPYAEFVLLGLRANLFRHRRDFESAIELATEMRSKALRTQSKEHIAESAKLLGCLKLDIGEPAGALPLLQESLSINRELERTQEVGKALYNLGTVHRASGEIEKAIQYFEQDLEICDKSNDAAGAAETMNTLALAHSEIGQFSKAEQYQREALQIFRTFGNAHSISIVCNDLAVILRHRGKTQEALELHFEDIERCNAFEDGSGEALAQANAAETLIELGREDEAAPRFGAAISTFRALRDERRLALTLIAQIPLLFKAELDNSAIDEATAAIEVLVNSGETRDAITAHHSLSNQFEMKSDHEQALFHAKEALRLGEEHTSPYLRAVSIFFALIPSIELERTNFVVEYAEQLRKLGESHPEMLGQLNERFSGALD